MKRRYEPKEKDILKLAKYLSNGKDRKETNTDESEPQRRNGDARN